VIAALAVALTVALALGSAAAVDASTAVPRGTTVLGVDIGGRTEAEAADALRAGLGDRLAEPVPLTLDGAGQTVDPAAIGLNVDADATAARAAQGWPNPFRAIFGGTRSVEPVVTVDPALVEEHLWPLVEGLPGVVTPASISFDGLTPKADYGAPGKGLDVPATAGALQQGWLRGAPVTVVLKEQHPTAAAEVDRVLAEFARPAVAAPVTVTSEVGELRVPEAAIAASLVISGHTDGSLTPVVDEEKLRTAMADDLARVEVPPQNATVEDDNGQPKIVASSGGRRIDTAKLSQDIVAVLPNPAPRTLAASMVAVAAPVTEADLAAQGIVEQISSFTTYYPAGQSRGKNIHRVADEVDGAIVKPGAVFSLNAHTGDRNYRQGYLDAPVIQGGRLVNGVGGGVSQFTTTLFNGMYYAGLEDVFHQPHSYYFSRYPAVIESTIFYPSLDMKFRNDSPHSVLIDTSYTDTSITVTFWGTKRYDISTEWGPRRNVTTPQTITLSGAGCIATDGINGFTQDAWRIFKQDGKEIKREKFTHRYRAEPRFICS
jgi:vancomycin resistance protein YoaR